MLVRTLILTFLLAMLFASPVAFAEEIGGGAPDQTTAAQPEAPTSESETDEDCWFEKLLDLFGI